MLASYKSLRASRSLADSRNARGVSENFRVPDARFHIAPTDWTLPGRFLKVSRSASIGVMYDPLLPLLPGPRDADRPWLICYGIDERVELTGHVLSMWLAKIAGLITSESTQGDGVHVGLPPHWRTVAWTCGAWLAGRGVLLGMRRRSLPPA